MSKIEEKILLLRIQHQRDAASFTKLYELLAEAIYRFIYFRVSDQEVAQDLTADVFAKCWRELVSSAGRGRIKHIRAYVYKMARNVVADYYRKKEIVLVHDDLVQIEDQPVSAQTITIVEQKIEFERLLIMIRTLKITYQEVLVLRYVEDFSISEIAHVLQKTPVAARVLLHRANQALKREYEKTA